MISPPYSNNRQQGLAIITVMLIIALMVTLLGYLVESQHLSIRRFSNQINNEKSYALARGAEQWAVQVLLQDINIEQDHYGEKWANLVKENTTQNAPDNDVESSIIDLGVGKLDVKIVDLQGRYNLNNLLQQEPEKKLQQQRIFLNLLEILEITDEEKRLMLYGALLDWLDTNDLRSAYGKESADYKNEKVSYLAADQPLTSIGELKFIDGFDKDIIIKLQPYVTALPLSDAKVNINTTSIQVLSALSSGPATNTAAANAFLVARDDPGFIGFDIENAVDAVISASGVGANQIPNMMQTVSDFFQIEIQVDLADKAISYKLITTIERRRLGESKQTITVLNRQRHIL